MLWRPVECCPELAAFEMWYQTVAFERLWRRTKHARNVYRSHSAGTGFRLHVPLLDTKPEGELEREINDVVEELGIMIHIHKTQKDVFRQFVSHVEHILDPAGTNAEKYFEAKPSARRLHQDDNREWALQWARPPWTALRQ